MIFETVSAYGGTYIEKPANNPKSQWYHYHRMARKQADWLRVWWLTGRGLACVKVMPTGAAYL